MRRAHDSLNRIWTRFPDMVGKLSNWSTGWTQTYDSGVAVWGHGNQLMVLTYGPALAHLPISTTYLR